MTGSHAPLSEIIISKYDHKVHLPLLLQLALVLQWMSAAVLHLVCPNVIAVPQEPLSTAVGMYNQCQTALSLCFITYIPWITTQKTRM